VEIARQKDGELRRIEAEIAAQLGDYERLKTRLLESEGEQRAVAAGQEALAAKCAELHAALAASQQQMADLQARYDTQAAQLAVAVEEASGGLAAAAQEEARATAAGQLQAAQQLAEGLQAQLEQRNQEVR
jgi:chromosome segregation ATPase